MVKDIKAIVCDLDGTLLNSQGEISNKDSMSLKRMKRQGIKIYIATGRGEEAFAILDGIEFDAIVLNNGMQIYYNSQQIYYKKLNKSIFRNFLEELKGSDVKLGIYMQIEEEEYALSKGKFLDISEYLYDDLPECFDKMFLRTGKRQNLNFINNILPADYYIVHTRDGYSFIMPKGISKCSGIRKIIDLENIYMSQVLVFGDDENDRDLIRQSGIGIAMGNALEDIKKISDLVTKTNDEQGIAHMIQYLRIGE